MSIYRAKITILWIAMLVFSQNASADTKMVVFVSIPPQKYFVQQVGKDLVDVGVMLEPGATPRSYEPNPRQMVALARARLYLAIGLEPRCVERRLT
jgi:zinc transport system substrate-binding protein